MTTQQKQVTENVTQQYAENVAVQVPVTVMTSPDETGHGERHSAIR